MSDQGGGISHDELAKVFRYGYTTMDMSGHSAAVSSSSTTAHDLQLQLDQSGNRYRMGGQGFGLPLSRLYAQYFGASSSCPLSVSAISYLASETPYIAVVLE